MRVFLYIFTNELIYRHGKAAGLRIVDIIGEKKAPLSTIVKAALRTAVMSYEKFCDLPISTQLLGVSLPYG